MAHASLSPFSHSSLGKLDVILRALGLTVLVGVCVSLEKHRNVGLVLPYSWPRGLTVDTCTNVTSEGFWISPAIVYVIVDVGSKVASPCNPDIICSVPGLPEEFNHRISFLRRNVEN